MKRVTFKGAMKAAAIMLLLPCAVMAAQPNAGKANNSTRPQIGQPVTAHNISVDLRNQVPQIRARHVRHDHAFR